MFKFCVLLLFCLHEGGRIDKRSNALKPWNHQGSQGLSGASLFWYNFNNGVTQESTQEGYDISFELIPVFWVSCALHSHENSQTFREKGCCQAYAWANLLSLSEKTNEATLGGKETLIYFFFFNLLHWVLESAEVGFQ